MIGAKRFHQEQRTRIALGAFEIIGVTEEIAEQSVNLRQEYGMKLPDAIILATAHVHRRELVTRNTKDFAGLPGVILPYTL